jgi:hypothetical protein
MLYWNFAFVNLIKGYVKLPTETGDNCWQRAFPHLRLNKQCAREVVNVRFVSGGYTFLWQGVKLFFENKCKGF